MSTFLQTNNKIKQIDININYVIAMSVQCTEQYVVNYAFLLIYLTLSVPQIACFKLFGRTSAVESINSPKSKLFITKLSLSILS